MGLENLGERHFGEFIDSDLIRLIHPEVKEYPAPRIIAVGRGLEQDLDFVAQSSAKFGTPIAMSVHEQ